MQFGEMRNSADGWWRWLHDSVNALDAPELTLSNGDDGQLDATQSEGWLGLWSS